VIARKRRTPILEDAHEAATANAIEDHVLDHERDAQICE